MKFQTTPYHFDLLKDYQRLSVFFEAIKNYDGKNNVAFDLGSGSGILSYFLKDYFDEIISLEVDCKAYDCASNNLSDFSNIELINTNVLDYKFDKKADLIVCEMLDTALIDEEEVEVLNYTRNFLKNEGKIIPKSIVNFAQLVNIERDYVHWDEDANYEVFSQEVNYSKFNFKDEINPYFEKILSIRPNKDGIVNGIKITSVTILDDNIVCGPTPMLNPALLIPIKQQNVKCDDLINIKLKYIMGKGIGSIETQIL